MNDTETKKRILNKLIKQQNFISVLFSLIILFLYFSFIIIIGFKPELFSFMVINNSIPFGIVFGISIIISSICLTTIYVLISNIYLDHLREKIKL